MHNKQVEEVVKVVGKVQASKMKQPNKHNTSFIESETESLAP